VADCQRAENENNWATALRNATDAIKNSTANNHSLAQISEGRHINPSAESEDGENKKPAAVDDPSAAPTQPVDDKEEIEEGDFIKVPGLPGTFEVTTATAKSVYFMYDGKKTRRSKTTVTLIHEA